ncbi:steroid 5-alpha reductase c-terminal domain-containing protein [Stylonychia lemnae]|uniref:Steroid 5-alpha reductase c-terminal domain-containing protein n=1 Tax=Stylonychia lemnae TaxID=5949 RepID=A0A077ZRX3_STYLE|nr:steroid 5-alpha reductase c-terminal domain-containing protein [Stylonychia lemnae]|eukprot:CDW72627.1 steroid 5-alpha reductase c-terminal domain-containing protein [Stylonychia lemnae]
MQRKNNNKDIQANLENSRLNYQETEASSEVINDKTTKGQTLKIYQAINLQKAMMPVYLVGLMYYYGNFSDQMIVYSIMHGSYGLLWIIKHFTFPDKSFEDPISIFGAIMIWVLVLGPYLVPGWIIASGYSQEITDKKWIYSNLVVYIFSVSVMLCSDAQKSHILTIYRQFNLSTKEKPLLINNGFFKYTRNPNYLGEMSLYFTFAALSNHWISYSIIFMTWAIVLMPGMAKKDESLMRKPGWDQYSQQSWRLIPKINGSLRDSIIFYSISITSIIFFFKA